MKISACYIVKNTAVELERSIRSISEYVDEIVVVDTGSTDDTKDVAGVLGAAVYEYAWQADFAAARNFAIEKATGTWIVFLDADEYIEDAHLLRRVIEQATADVLLLTIVNIDEDKAGQIIDAFFAPRIFRNRENLRYEGRIHEQLLKAGRSVRQMMVVPETDLVIYHTGYSSAIIRAKAQRNLNMLLKEFAQEDHPENFYLALAECYAGIGEMESALQYARLEIARGRQQITYASRAYRLYLRLLEQQHNPDTAEIRAVLLKAIRDFPELPEFQAEYAQYMALDLDYKGAVLQMEQALRLGKPAMSVERSLFDDTARRSARQLVETWKQVKYLSEHIRISACVIVKNEDKNIDQWIANMKVCTDEQILIDTGSEDNTVAIALAAGIHVFHYEWKDDFAAAKNFAIENATGEWIVFLDADEYFSPDTIGNVRKIIAREHLRASEVDAILCPIINIDADCGNREISRFANLRIFRKDACLHYQGVIHETLCHKERNIKAIMEGKHISIYHTGYSSQRIRAKLKRNLSILQADIAQTGEHDRHYRYLMDCYQGLGNHDKAIVYGQKFLNSGNFSLADTADAYRILINSMTFLKKPLQEIKGYIEEALRLLPDLPDFYAYYGSWLFCQKDFAEAKKYLLQALSIYENRLFDTITSSAFASIVSETYSHLGEIFLKENNREMARKYLELAIKDNKYNGHAFQQLCFLEGERSIVSVDRILARYYLDDQKTLFFIVQNLETSGADEVYFHYAERLEKEYKYLSQRTKWHRLLVEGRQTEVYQQSLQMIVERMQQLACALLCMDRDELITQAEDCLSSGLWQCVLRYHGEISTLKMEDADAYMALLPAVIDLEQEQVLRHFLSISQDFSTENRRTILFLLFEKKCWLAIEEMEDLATDLQVDPEILRIFGIAAYYRRHFLKARDYLNKVLGDFKGNDIEAYLIWIDERIKME